MSQAAFFILVATVSGLLMVSGFIALLFRYQARVIEQERRVARVVISAQEQEQGRIAAELHDGLGVELVAAKHLLSKTIHSADDDGQRKALEDLRLLMDGLYQEQRRISHDLMPSNIERHGLVDAIDELAKRINETDKLKVHLACAGNYRRMDPEKELMVYRVIQEFAHNTIKHAEAARLDISVASDASGVNFVLPDDGKGFRLTVGTSPGIGIKSMENRIRLVNGQFAFSSEPGAGTSLVISIKT